MAKKEEKKEEMSFPRNVYTKNGDNILYSNGKKYTYSTLLVKGEEDYNNALEAGYEADFSCVLLEKTPKEKEAAEKEDDF